MEQPKDVKFTSTGRPYIMAEYTTSKGNKAMRAKFIKMSDAGGAVADVPSKIGGPGGVLPLKYRRAGPGGVLPLVLSESEVSDLVDEYSAVHGKMTKDGDLEGAGLFHFFEKLVPLSTATTKKIVLGIAHKHPPSPIDEASGAGVGGGAVSITNTELQEIVNALPKTANMTKTDLKTVLKFRKQISGSPEASGGFLGTLLKLGLPFALKGLAWLGKKIFGRKKKS